jgi:DNA-binding CsgD family transcriptional regulator
MNSAIVFSGLAPLSVVVRTVLPGGTCVVGRSFQCDVIMDHPSVSRRHAEITPKGTRFLVTDLRSRNGTFVAGERIVGKAEVEQGQRIRFGNLEFYIALREITSAALEWDVESDTLPVAPAPAFDQLTKAQCRIVELLADGLAEKRIAAILGISRHTVHNHVSAIYRAFAVHSRAELLSLVQRTSRF